MNANAGFLARPGQPIDVCIQGAGPVGATLALALSHQGLKVALVGGAPATRPAAPATAAAPARPDLRAYALNAASVALLRELRIWDGLPADAATPVQEMRVHGDAGGALEFSAWQQCVDALAWIVDAGALDQALATALRFAPHVSRVAEPVPVVLTAVCEGRDSATRARLGVHFERHPYGHQAVAAWIASDQPHHGTAWQWFRSPEVLALLPFDHAAAGCGYGLVWSQPEAQAAQWLAAAPAEFEAALMDATQGAAGTLRLVSPRAAWPLQAGQADRWCGEGWVLLGDAAHAVHPLAGQGLNLGLGDVISLNRVLAEARRDSPWRTLGDARTLRRYARERAAPTRAISGFGDSLWHLFAQAAPPLQELRNHGMTLVNHLPPLKRWLAARALGH
jgi:2-polyprenyl-6-methoxyphenol hydroxylase-like FAD-dependent oxidoreductase